MTRLAEAFRFSVPVAVSVEVVVSEADANRFTKPLAVRVLVVVSAAAPCFLMVPTAVSVEVVVSVDAPVAVPPLPPVPTPEPEVRTTVPKTVTIEDAVSVLVLDRFALATAVT